LSYLLKSLFDQRSAARVVSVKKGAHGLRFDSAEFIERWPPGEKVQRDVRFHAIEEIDG
jgi:hypothetical protein